MPPRLAELANPNNRIALNLSELAKLGFQRLELIKQKKEEVQQVRFSHLTKSLITISDLHSHFKNRERKTSLD